MLNKETQLQKKICNYIKFRYPDVTFTADMSGAFLSSNPGAWQTKKLFKEMRSEPGIPDILIFQTTGKVSVLVETDDGKKENLIVFQYAGLFLEVKKESPYYKKRKTKDGKPILKKNEQIAQQAKVHDKLRQQGYVVRFVWELKQAKAVIDEYMGL
jgi:hypothetical protein